MKTSLLTIVLTLFLIATQAWATPSSGTAVQNKFATTNVGTTTWVPLVTSTVRGLSGVTIYNSSPSPLEVGVATASAAANSEVRQMIVPGTLGVTAPTNLFYPLQVGYGTRVSVRALGSTATTGELDMSLFYN